MRESCAHRAHGSGTRLYVQFSTRIQSHLDRTVKGNERQTPSVHFPSFQVTVHCISIAL